LRSRSASARRPRIRIAVLVASLGLLLSLTLTACATGGGPPPAGLLLSPRFCDRPQLQSAREQDRLLRFAALVREQLESSGAQVALISRTGIDLKRFGVRFSHSGVSVREGGEVPWAVRQLYYACDEHRPRLYDQGIGGFLLNTDDAALGHVSIVVLPQQAARQLLHAALDTPRALRLLAARYSANAYPFSVRYQNCNQWVMELLASAWGNLADGDDLRKRAQDWLALHGYAPPPVALDSHWLKFAAAFMPLVHLDDHPEDDRYGMAFRISMPAAMEAFVRQHLPEATRIELCHDEHQVVVRHGWEPIADGCRPAGADRVIALD
jgi:hypothetical protein